MHGKSSPTAVLIPGLQLSLLDQIFDTEHTKTRREMLCVLRYLATAFVHTVTRRSARHDPQENVKRFQKDYEPCRTEVLLPFHNRVGKRTSQGRRVGDAPETAAQPGARSEVRQPRRRAPRAP